MDVDSEIGYIAKVSHPSPMRMKVKAATKVAVCKGNQKLAQKSE